jgi:hypothetical protein
MERLTRIDSTGRITGAKRGKGDYVGHEEIVARLHEYEDTNLTPAEIVALQAEYKRLRKENEELRAQALPCKIGDVFYGILRRREYSSIFNLIMPWTVSMVQVTKKGCIIRASGKFKDERTTQTTFHELAIGERFFWTEDEAKAALEGK